MRGIIYTDDGKFIDIVDDENNYSLPKDFLNLRNDILTIVFYNSFGYNFTEFYNKQGLIEKIFEYEKKYGAPGGDDDDISQINPAINQEEALKKPPDLDDVKLSCRYFCYKKPNKQNYAYIKYK
jgi:hypothetical protein